MRTRNPETGNGAEPGSGGSTNLELLVTEVGDDLEETSEGDDVAVEHVDAGELAVLDLAEPAPP